MRASIVLASLCAALSAASPINLGLRKKEYVTDITTEIVYVTVTVGAPTSSSEQHQVTTVNVFHTVVVVPTEAAPTTSSTPLPPPPPPPPPSTTSTSLIPEPTYVAPAITLPETTSTTQAAPAPAPTTSAPVVQAAAPSTVVVIPATTAAPVSAASPTDYESTALYHHNQHRANHSANALAWDSTLAGYAAITAAKCIFAHDMYEGTAGYGQNLAAYGSSDLSTATNVGAVADGITNQWYYGEADNMPYGVASPSITGAPEFLHFSAMLWKSSTTVGCATATCQAGTVFPDVASLFTVCNYKEEGNINGEFDTEVGRPIGLAPIAASVTA